MLWNTVWPLVKDVALTGTGIALIVSQMFSARPSDVLLVTGLALTVPSIAGHAVQLLSGPHAAGGSTSPPSPQSGRPHSGPSQEGDDDAG